MVRRRRHGSALSPTEPSARHSCIGSRLIRRSSAVAEPTRRLGDTGDSPSTRQLLARRPIRGVSAVDDAVATIRRRRQAGRTARARPAPAPIPGTSAASEESAPWLSARTAPSGRIATTAVAPCVLRMDGYSFRGLDGNHRGRPIHPRIFESDLGELLIPSLRVLLRAIGAASAGGERRGDQRAGRASRTPALSPTGP